MMFHDAAKAQTGNWMQIPLVAILALGIFALDVLSPLQGAVAVLYTAVVLVAARSNLHDRTIGAAFGCTFLALIGYVIGHGHEPMGSAAVRLCVSLIAIAITTTLSIRHQRIAESRRVADQRYRTIFNAAGFPIWEADWSEAYAMLSGGRVPDEDVIEHTGHTAIICTANQAAAALFGLAHPDELVGGTIVRFKTPDADAALGRILTALVGGAMAVEEEARFIAANGEPIDLLLRVTLPPRPGGWRQVMVMALDITESKQAQQRLAQAHAELAHVSRVTTLGQLAASIAHEVNQPLTALITYAKSGKRWLAREAPDAAEVDDCLNQIVSNGTRAADVIARIRALAQRADPRRDVIDLAALIDETLQLLQRDLSAHDVDVSISLPETLPALEGDHVQIQQVLMNLMLNAEQAMAQTAHGARFLWIDGSVDAGGVTISVRDSGTGIVDVDPERLFNPFFSTKSDGMGIGLSICRSIMERHGGSLLAANHPDGGAVFSFRIPAAQQEFSAA